MFNQQFNQQFNNGMQPNNGYNYGRPLDIPKMQQGLTQNEQEFLRNQAANQFSFTAVTDEDLIKAKCTHKYNNSWDVENLDISTGLVECRTCHERFHLVDLEPDEADKIVENMVDMLQTAKYMYVDIKPELASQFFQIIPLVKQAGKIYTLALQNIAKYDGNYNLNQNNDQYAFQQLNGLMTGNVGYGMGYGMQQQMPDPSNPFYGQQFAYNPQPGYGAVPQQPYNSGMGYNPQQGYNPQPGYGFAPQQPGVGYQQQPNNQQQPQAPTSESVKDIQVNKTYNK